MVSLIINLYGKPCWDMELEKCEIDNSEMFKVHGKKLKNKLYKVSNLIGKLLELGWRGVGGTYEVIFYKNVSEEEAKKELEILNLDLNYVYIDWRAGSKDFCFEI